MNSFKDKKDGFLVEMSLLGNEKAYEELVIRHEGRVRGTAFKVTENEFSAEDASQDAFVSAWINLDSLRDGEKFGAWVCSIAKNCAVNLVAHYKSACADISLNLVENTVAFEEGGFSELFRTLEKEELHKAVESLNEKIRETVKLHYFEGLSVKEIARVQNLPLGTVKWRLNEGRKQLRKEYGIMENIRENASFVQKVMYQVEQLKLWRLKNDKTGFEADYRKVLENVEMLEESVEKHHALSDVLMRGYWWLPGEKNDDMLKKIKKSAEKSHNEEVMQSVICCEYEKYNVKERLNYMLNTQVPYLEEKGFCKTLGYIWFWIGYCYIRDDRVEDGIAAYKKVLEILNETDVYYANALSAIYVEEKESSGKVDRLRSARECMGEVYKIINGKTYFWEQPGYMLGNGFLLDGSLFWNSGCCDGLLMDENIQPGESIASTDGKITLTCKDKGIAVKTVSGEYKNCVCFIESGDYYGLRYCETYYCPGIGIVKQINKRSNGIREWQLKSYKINGGEGLLPLACGNRWEYEYIDREDGVSYDAENVFEVVSFENDTAVVSHYSFVKTLGYKDTWFGNICKARKEYFSEDGNSLRDVRECFVKAEELAGTKHQKLHTAIAKDVMNRILDSDPDLNPDYKVKGRWDFFNCYEISSANNQIAFSHNRRYDFEWKDATNCGDEGYKVLYNFLYDSLNDNMGTMWSDEWIKGYRTEKNFKKHADNVSVNFEVLDDETIKTEKYVFENCRHVSLYVKGYTYGRNYQNGKKDYWFAPGIGIVKFTSSYKNDELLAVWELTDYKGKSDGYFPVEDGIFRRYEPRDLGNGWHGSVEYTFSKDGNDMILFRNALGNQDRANFEAENPKNKE